MSEESAPISKAVFAIILNPRLCPARHTAVVEGLPALISAFGLSFTGQIYKHVEGEQVRITPLYGYLTPLEGDPDTQEPRRFARAVSSLINAIQRTALSELFKSVACLSCWEGREPPLKEVVLHLTMETLLQMKEEGDDVEGGAG